MVLLALGEPGEVFQDVGEVCSGAAEGEVVVVGLVLVQRSKMKSRIKSRTRMKRRMRSKSRRRSKSSRRRITGRCVSGAGELVEAVLLPFLELFGGVGDAGVGLFQAVEGGGEAEQAVEVVAFVTLEGHKAVVRIITQAAGEQLAGEKGLVAVGFLLLLDKQLTLHIGEALAGPGAADELVEEVTLQGVVGLELGVELGLVDLEGGGALAGKQG